FLLESVAATASFLGSRKLRAYPAATLTTSPRVPSLSTSSLRMTSIGTPLWLGRRKRPPHQILKTRRERQQRDIPRLLDRIRQPALMRRAHAGNPARHNLAPLRDEAVQQFRVLIVDVVDLLDAEPADFLPPEILLLLRSDGLVTAGRPLGCAAWSSSGFRHNASLFLPFLA